MRTLLFFVVLSVFQLGFSQKEANNWYFGRKAGITFNTNPPSELINGKFDWWFGSASISDANGKFLFCTDGETVWFDSLGIQKIMKNGKGIKGLKNANQPAIIVPRPDSAHIYYIFTVGYGINDTNGLNYSEVNMNLNGGKGAVVSNRKNIKLLYRTNGKISAVQHSNGRDYWVIASKYKSDSLFSFKITNTGVSNTPIINKTGLKFSKDSLFTQGALKISPDGKKIAISTLFCDSAVIGNFDASTGKISNLWTFHINDGFGVEFSPRTKYLYLDCIKHFIRGGFSYRVLQFDLSANSQSAFISSQITVDSN